MAYKLGSLFDGSGGFPLSGTLCGIEPCWAAEVEPYPIAVTRSRFPSMKHLGDISKVNGAEIEPVDIITFGSPCQDLSVAGKRAGLKHEANGDEETTRSGLFMEAVRIIKEMREATNGEYPTFALWENVPGAFSSNKGEDFRIVCEELIKVVEPTAVMPAVPKNGWPYADSYIGDGWSLAYRVFDAQYWGVPQRRRRIYLVADFRGERAREVLFEREGLRGHLAESGTPWQGIAAHAEGSVGADDCTGDGVNCLNPWDSQTIRQYAVDGVFPALYANSGGGQNRAGVVVPCVGADDLEGVCYEPRSMKEENWAAQATKNALRAGASKSSHVIVEPVPAVVCKTWDARGNGDGETVSTLTGDHENRITDYSSVVCEPVIDVEMEVAVRKYEVDQEKLVALLRSHKGALSNREIAEKLDRPVTMVEHWFRTDKCSAIPDPDVWYQLKALLGIETNEFDRCITEFEFKGGNYDMRNRIYAGDVSPTLTCGSGNDLHLLPEKVICLQGNGIDRADTAGCNGKGWKEDTCYTLNTIDRPAVAYQDKVGALCRSDYKGVGNQYISDSKAIVERLDAVRYIVRRLTPTECARLQGFADRWGDIDEKDSFTPEEFEFWHEVRNTHAAINGKVVKEYTKAQMLAWYNKLHTDSAEYKMWGNGIALPPALYCLQGIVEALNNPGEEDDDAWMN